MSITCVGCGAEFEGRRHRVFYGDATDNRRVNLRLVCPNCDSQLPTYKSRNRGKGRHYRRERYAEGRSY